MKKSKGVKRQIITSMVALSMLVVSHSSYSHDSSSAFINPKETPDGDGPSIPFSFLYYTKDSLDHMLNFFNRFYSGAELFLYTKVCDYFPEGAGSSLFFTAHCDFDFGRVKSRIETIKSNDTYGCREVYETVFTRPFITLRYQNETQPNCGEVLD